MDAGRRELEFLGTLGRGGFGTVYLANLHGRDRFVRRVAVKVLRQSVDDPELVARQRDEARLLGLLTHQAIVQVVDLTEVHGRPAVVMEYVDGIDLAAVIRAHRERGTPLPVRAMLETVAVAASGLDAAWNTPAPGSDRPLRAIHRDVKPANILLTAHGGVKLLDFGIARADMDREGVTGSAFYGTAGYMGPEFWLQEPIGPGYDVYALGVTLLEALTRHDPGRPPLEPARFEEWRDERVLAAPPELQPLLRGMLAFRAADRPTAAQVQEQAEALADHASDEPLSRFSRRVVPPLVAARLAALDAEALPTRTVAGVLEPGQTPPSAVVAPTPTPPVPVAPPPLWFRWRGGILVVGVSAILLALGAWLLRPSAPLPGPPATVPAPDAVAVLAAPPPAVPVDPPAGPAPAAEVVPAAPAPVEAAPVSATPTAAPGPTRPRSTPSAPVPAVSDAAPVTPPPPPETAPAEPEPTARVATAAPASAPTWTLSVLSIPPGATVTIDGAPRGSTSLDGIQLATGRHELRVALDGVEATRTLDAGPDLPSRLTYNFATGRWRSEYR